MKRILVAGAGKIGRLIAVLLSHSGRYTVILADKNAEMPELKQFALHHGLRLEPLTAEDPRLVQALCAELKLDGIISSLPYYCNPVMATVAKALNCAYFDLTEDRQVTEKVKQLAQNAAVPFVPQCGLAPGFISIVAHELIQRFDSVETVCMRVGALPAYPNNALNYSLTWSTDGLINEYGNPCHALVQGEDRQLMPLEGLESIHIDGEVYEAFNTSGGLGSLAETYKNKVPHMNYKTLRYPGHCEKMRLLMNDLKLNENRPLLKQLLENAVPKTFQDVVLVYVAVKGLINGELYEDTYVKKIYPQDIAGQRWSAIQVTTATGLCGVFDLVMSASVGLKGFIRQESIALNDFIKNEFGRYYA